MGPKNCTSFRPHNTCIHPWLQSSGGELFYFRSSWTILRKYCREIKLISHITSCSVQCRLVSLCDKREWAVSLCGTRQWARQEAMWMLCQHDFYCVLQDWIKNDIQTSETHCKVLSYHQISLRVKQAMATAHTEWEQQDTRNYTPLGVRPLIPDQMNGSPPQCGLKNTKIKPNHAWSIIIIIIIFICKFMRDIYNYTPETNHVSTAYNVPTVLWLQLCYM
jgi:hypothetical protein